MTNPQPQRASQEPAGYAPFPSLRSTPSDKPAPLYSLHASDSNDAEEAARLVPTALGARSTDPGIAAFSLSGPVVYSTQHGGHGHAGTHAGSSVRRSDFGLLCLAGISLTALALSIWAVSSISLVQDDHVLLRNAVYGSGSGSSSGAVRGASVAAGSVPVSRIAFGSCTAYDLRPQPVWTEVRGGRIGACADTRIRAPGFMREWGMNALCSVVRGVDRGPGAW